MSETQNGDRRVSGPRLIALVGPFQSGKTTLLEGILARSGALVAAGQRARRLLDRRFQRRGARPCR